MKKSKLFENYVLSDEEKLKILAGELNEVDLPEEASEMADFMIDANFGDVIESTSIFKDTNITKESSNAIDVRTKWGDDSTTRQDDVVKG